MIIDYSPHKAQRAIHRALKPYLSALIVMCICGRQFGKTEIAIQEIVKRAIEQPGARIWYIAPTKDQAYRIAWRRMLQILPRSEIRKKREDLHYIELKNDSLIEFYGTQHEVFLLGPTLHFVVFDEFPTIPFSVWVDTVRPMLMRFHGDAFFIGTIPDPKVHNITIEFLDMYEQGLRQGGLGGTESFNFSTFENPHIPQEEIKKQIKELKRKGRGKDANRLYHGKYTREYGLVFPKFNYDFHTVEPFEIPRDWTRAMAADPHPQKPIYALWAALDAKNDIWFYREKEFTLPEGRPQTVQEAAFEILVIENTAKERILDRRLDPTFAKIKQAIIGQKSVKDLFRDNGVLFRDADRAFLPFFNQMTDRLVDLPNPTVHIFRSCPGFIRQMENWMWEPWASPHARAEKGVKNKPKSVDDDYLDCSKYIMNANIRQVDLGEIRGFHNTLIKRWERRQYL